MRAEEIWKVSTGKGISVAVLDTGVGETSDLKGRLLPGIDVTGSLGGPNDDYDGHGTTMAELIAGSGEEGAIRGLAPGAQIISIRKSDSHHGRGSDDTEKAIRAAADSDAKIISMSFAGDFMYPQVGSALKYAESKGKLLIAGVGNNGAGRNNPQFPAAFPEVVGVAAADAKGSVGKFSQHGKYVDLAGPGVNMPGRCDKTLTSYCTQYGTSHATAITSAAAALIWSAHPDWTANQVLRVMLDTAARDWPKEHLSVYLGYGLVSPSRVLLKGQGNPGDPNINPLTGERSGPQTSPKPKPSPTHSVPDKPAETPQHAAAVEPSGGGGGKWWLIGIAAAAVVALGVTVLVRSRRGNSTQV